jgi:hypothetical protein
MPEAPANVIAAVQIDSGRSSSRFLRVCGRRGRDVMHSALFEGRRSADMRAEHDESGQLRLSTRSSC